MRVHLLTILLGVVCAGLHTSVLAQALDGTTTPPCMQSLCGVQTHVHKQQSMASSA